MTTTLADPFETAATNKRRSQMDSSGHSGPARTSASPPPCWSGAGLPPQRKVCIVSGMTEYPDEFIGYLAAARYLGLRPKTLSSYVSAGRGPEVNCRCVVGVHVLPVFTRRELDRWRASRPGRGYRRDLHGPADR